MTNEEYRALVEQSHQLQQLTEHPGWAVLVDYIKTVVLAPRKDRLLNGAIDSLDEYKKQAGFCAGAEWVLNAHEVIGNQALRERERREEDAEVLV